MPAWIPWGNVYSVGDVLIAAGIAAKTGDAWPLSPADRRLERNHGTYLVHEIENTSA